MDTISETISENLSVALHDHFLSFISLYRKEYITNRPEMHKKISVPVSTDTELKFLYMSCGRIALHLDFDGADKMTGRYSDDRFYETSAWK